MTNFGPTVIYRDNLQTDFRRSTVDAVYNYMPVSYTHLKVPGNHIVRSVYVKEDRIYVGAFEEFGYFKYSEAGTLRYLSLIHI